MCTCSFLRIATTRQAHRCAKGPTGSHLLRAILSAIAGIVLCRGLRDLLASIPDSNDDFTFH